MKKILLALLLFISACSKSSSPQENKGTLAVYNESTTIIVDSVMVNGVLYKTDLGLSKSVFPVGPVSGTVSVYLSGSAGIIVFRDSDGIQHSAVISAGHFTISEQMNLSGKGVVPTITISDN